MADTDADPTAPRGRRALLRASALGAAGAALLPAAAARAAGTYPFPNQPRYRLVFVNHVTTNPFFVPTQYGIADACALLNCDHQWTGSANADVSEMVNAINAAVAARASAIAVPIVDPRAFDAPVARALDSGIPVFAYNADSPPGSGNRRLAYIGQDLYQAGVLMGRRIAQLVEGGTVALMIATPGQLNLQPRLDGARDAIAKSGRKIDVQVVATGATVNEELSRIKAFYLGHQDLKGMFAVDGGSTQGVAETMSQYGLAAKGVHGGGFDVLPRTLQLLRAGALDFAIDQQPYIQGFYTCMEMVMFLNSGGLTGPADVNTGLKFVTKAEAAQYLDTATRYEGSSDRPQVVPRSGPIGG